MSQVWFTADTHFNHGSIIGYCGRPYRDLSQMNRDLVERWNARVAPEDTVYHLGDVALGPVQEWPSFVGVLAGYKILVKGNHDGSTRRMLASGFAEVHPEQYLDLGGTLLWLAHVPTDNTDDHRPLYRPQARWSYDLALCGHVHHLWQRRGDCLNVGVDVWDYAPVSAAQVLAAAAAA